MKKCFTRPHRLRIVRMVERLIIVAVDTVQKATDNPQITLDVHLPRVDGVQTWLEPIGCVESIVRQNV